MSSENETGDDESENDAPVSLQVLGISKDGAARPDASDHERPAADMILHSPPANTQIGHRPVELDPAARRHSDSLYRLLDSQVSLIFHPDALVMALHCLRAK